MSTIWSLFAGLASGRPSPYRIFERRLRVCKMRALAWLGHFPFSPRPAAPLVYFSIVWDVYMLAADLLTPPELLEPCPG